jgi:hypothetical protein
MKKIITMMLVLSIILGAMGASIALAACDGKSRSYGVTCWLKLWVYQFAKATHSAECNNNHSVTLTTKLVLAYTDGTSESASGTSYVEKQVPAGKVGSKASGTFNAKCSGGYIFPQRSATDNW